MVSWAKRNWLISCVSALGVAVGWIASPKALTSVSQELIALFGMLLAGALPTMILTATILRAGAFSPRRVGEYAAALEKQLSFWFSLFIWALLACIAVTATKAAWDDHHPYVISIHHVQIGKWKSPALEYSISRLGELFLGLAGAQVLYRLFPMLSGLRSLLRLNSTIATEEAAEKAKAKLPPGAKELKDVKPPEGHGAVVED